MPNYFDTQPEPATTAPRKRFSTIIDRRSHEQKIEAKRKLQAGGFLKRTGKPLPPKSVVKINRRSKKRERNDPARIYGPEAFVTFLHSEQCLGCGAHRPIEQAHRFTGGTGRKDSWQRTIPLCGPSVRHPEFGGALLTRGCHHHYDGAKQSWSRDHNLPARAEHFWNRWLLHCGRLGLNPETGKSDA